MHTILRRKYLIGIAAAMAVAAGITSGLLFGGDDDVAAGLPAGTPSSVAVFEAARATGDTMQTPSPAATPALPTGTTLKTTATATPSVQPTGSKSPAKSISAKPTTTPPTATVKAAVKPTASADKAPGISTLILQFRVKASGYYDDASYSSNHYAYTASEVKMLATVIYLEARNQPYSCKLAVGNVVMNRVLSPGYPGNTVKEVVTRPNQFCYNASAQPDAECTRAAKDILERETWVVPQNTYFFRAIASKSNWGSHPYYAHFGNTAFYRGTYAGRYNGGSVPSQLYSRTYEWPQYGCKAGARVRKIQIMLDRLGYKTGTDGYFGAGTKSALIRFQKAQHLEADGIAGPATLRALIKKYGVSKYLKL